MSTGQATCACGCGAPPISGRRFLKGHNRRRPLVERFWERVEKADSCWLWRGTISNKGYGHLPVARTTALAHRVSYELHVGPIPEGLQLDHLCRNRACVNPAHLEPVTAKENLDRAAALITHCPQGHEYTPENMIVRRGERRRECRQCNRDAALRRYHARKAVA